MNIEELVRKHSRAFSGDVRGLRNALTEQAEAFKGELQSYDGMVRELTKTVEDMQAAQSVAVVGEPVACGVTKRYEDNVWFISDSRFTAQHYANQYAHRIGSEPDQVVVPLYAAPTHSIPAAELATLREKAAEADELRKDAEIAVTSIYIALDALNEIIEMDGQDNLGDAKREATKAMAQLAAIAQGKGE